MAHFAVISLFAVASIARADEVTCGLSKTITTCNGYDTCWFVTQTNQCVDVRNCDLLVTPTDCLNAKAACMYDGVQHKCYQHIDIYTQLQNAEDLLSDITHGANLSIILVASGAAGLCTAVVVFAILAMTCYK